ncbi:hypothetical protein K2X30_10805 [bacterium]|nr:hypothetical protein [bacterium]
MEALDGEFKIRDFMRIFFCNPEKVLKAPIAFYSDENNLGIKTLHPKFEIRNKAFTVLYKKPKWTEHINVEAKLG